MKRREFLRYLRDLSMVSLLSGCSPSPTPVKPTDLEEIMAGMANLPSGSVIVKVNSHHDLLALARKYIASGDYNKAQALAESALDLAKKNKKKNKVSDYEFSACMVYLASVYEIQMCFDKAQQQCEKGLKLQRKAILEEYGYEGHPDVAYTLRILSSIYKGQGKFQEAKTTIDDAMDIMLNYTPPDSPELDEFNVDIANLLVIQGEFKKAEALYLPALKPIEQKSIEQRYLPRDPLYLATVSSYVANLYVLQGKYLEAESLIKGALATQEKIYGHDNHRLIPAWLIQARIHQGKGNYEKAKNLLENSLDVVRKTGYECMISKVEKDIKKIRAKR